MNISILNNTADLAGFWPTTEFNDAYPEAALKGLAVASISKDDTDNPNTVALFVLRTHIQNESRASVDQKYVIGIRFCAFGDLAIIDLISLDRGFHKNIAFEHIQRMKWPTMSDLGRPIEHYEETMRAPFIIAGGHLKVDENGVVTFFANSGDYGDTVFFAETNAIASYVASSCGINVSSEKEKDEIFINDLLEFMLAHKLQKDFYEKFTDHIINKAGTGPNVFSKQTIGSILTMKSLDRAIAEEKDMTQTMIEEMVEGYGRHFLVANVAHMVKVKQQD